MSLHIPAKEQLKILEEGCVDLISREEFLERLEKSIKEQNPLRIKYGADPSSADLHLGHTVPLRKLRQFQELGHLVVFIVGDFTARIGDPTQRNETRPMLSVETVNENARTYQQQVFKILDPSKTEVRPNSHWLDTMKPSDFLHLTAQYTVARLLERDDFQKRYKSNQPIAVVEFLYPLLQGYDSVVVKSDLEIGGTDQKFNLLVGRELQKVWGQKPQLVMTLPLLEGTDGVQKMSKSYKNAIPIQDAPREMFGKVMSIPDKLVERYFQYASGMKKEEYQRYFPAAFQENPRDVKAALAERIVDLFWENDSGRMAREEFDRIFRDKGLPDDIAEIALPQNPILLVEALKESALVPSKNEARRMIEQGGVKVNQQKVTDINFQLDLNESVLVQCGKRKFARFRHGR